MATIVLVHGGTVGGWGWKQVRQYLQAAGHEVYTPTLTGLGERVHLASPDVSLETHIQDVVNVLTYEDLHDVVLVGHSYGGMVITGVADRIDERIQQLVYLDAQVPHDGESVADLTVHAGSEAQSAPMVVAMRAARAEGQWQVRLPAGADPRASPALVNTSYEPIHLTRPPATLPRSFIRCVVPSPYYPLMAVSEQRARTEPGWRYYELATNHLAQLSAPRDTADLLLQIVAETPVPTR